MHILAHLSNVQNPVWLMIVLYLRGSAMQFALGIGIIHCGNPC